MRTIEVSEVTRLVRQLCIDANYYLPADLRQAFVDGQNAEESPLGKTIFGEMIANCDLARENNVPVCQDTGMAIVFAEIGQDVHLTGGSFEDAVTEGVRRGYIDGYLRLSVVGDPLPRKHQRQHTVYPVHLGRSGRQGEDHGCPQGLRLGEYDPDEDVHACRYQGADRGFYRGCVHPCGFQPVPADRYRRRFGRHER